MPQSGWLINHRNLFLMVLKAGIPRSGCQHAKVLLKNLLQVASFWQCPHIEQSRELSGGLFYKNAKPNYDGSMLMT